MVKPFVESQQSRARKTIDDRQGRLTSSMEEDQNRLLLLLLPRLLSSKRGPDIEGQTILALRSASTARKSIDNALRLWRETREVDRLGSRLRTIAGDILSANERRRPRITQ